MLAIPDDPLRKLRIITKKELRLLVPYVPQHILRLENEGKFPKRIKIGENRVGWLWTEIEEWLRKRIADRDGNSHGHAKPSDKPGDKPAA
jgi:prophage regulatory protein